MTRDLTDAIYLDASSVRRPRKCEPRSPRRRRTAGTCWSTSPVRGDARAAARLGARDRAGVRRVDPRRDRIGKPAGAAESRGSSAPSRPRVALAARGRHARAVARARALRRGAGGARCAGRGGPRRRLALGDLHLDRGQPAEALAAFERARRVVAADSVDVDGALIGTGRALGSSRAGCIDAEAAFRTALARGAAATPARTRGAARRRL